MSLLFESQSDSLKMALIFINSNLVNHIDSIRKINVAYHRAVEALIYDLLNVSSLGPSSLGYRSLRPASFVGQRVGYKPFVRCLKLFEEEKYIVVRKGYCDRSTGIGEATRLRPTQKLLDILADYGITRANFRGHFRLAVQNSHVAFDPVRVRASRTGDWWDQRKGQLIPIDERDLAVRPLIQQVQRLNKFMANQHIEHLTISDPMHSGFYRLFNQGDQPDFAYNKGGRLYSYGSYQRITREDRMGLRVNGEPTVEVDVSGSHLTIFHAMMGVPLLPSVDPYAVPGIPRAIVKSFIVMSLGNAGFQRRWSLPIAKEYRDEHGVELQAAYPLAVTREAVLKYLPALTKLPESGITWADLQYRESLGLIEAVETLAYQHDVPALPLHDSVIVPVSKKKVAIDVMKEAFRKRSDVTIKVNVKMCKNPKLTPRQIVQKN